MLNAVNFCWSVIPILLGYWALASVSVGSSVKSLQPTYMRSGFISSIEPAHVARSMIGRVIMVAHKVHRFTSASESRATAISVVLHIPIHIAKSQCALNSML